MHDTSAKYNTIASPFVSQHTKREACALCREVEEQKHECVTHQQNTLEIDTCSWMHDTSVKWSTIASPFASQRIKREACALCRETEEEKHECATHQQNA